jgi:SPP1 gp7 family putative phage head morphogenesis protein
LIARNAMRHVFHGIWDVGAAEQISMQKKKSPFEKTKAAESNYARDLKRIAREIGNIINRFNVVDIHTFSPLRAALEKYADILRPWAKLRAAVMLAHVDRSDRRAWKSATSEMSQGLQDELASAPIGNRYKELMLEQVDLITSLPREAAERVHKLVTENVTEQSRPTEIAREIARSGEVASSRAKTIARTEVSRAATVLTQARAEFIGSDGYVWRTVRDADVRESHRKMEGKFVKWDNPPTLDGLTGHAGALPNCRCYPEPVIPENLT